MTGPNRRDYWPGASAAEVEMSQQMNRLSRIAEAPVKAAAIALCKSGKFETGQGTCAALCMEFLGSPRKGDNGCPHAERIHGELARVVLAAAEKVAPDLYGALDAIAQYGSDTLSGRADGPDDRAWQRGAVLEMTRRARAALTSRED